MSASSLSDTSGRSAKVWFIALGAVILLAGLYTAAWFYAASALKANVLKALGKQNEASFTGECVNLDQQGFPFNIGLTCSKVEIDDHAKGVSGTFANLSASSHVYSPGHISWQLSSPAQVRTAQGLSVSSEWTDMQSTLITQGRGIEQGATTINGLKTAILSSFTNQSGNFTADRAEINVRQNQGDLEAVVVLKNANTVIKDFPADLPAVDANIDITLGGRAGLLDGTDDTHGLYNTAGILHHATADIGDGRVMTLSGPFSFDDQGFISGQFKLEIHKIGHWRDSIKQVIPGSKHIVDMAGKLLKAMAAGDDKVSVDLTADHGAVTLSGFIPVGTIPPL